MRWRRVLSFLIFTFVLFLSCALAFARAGGGQGYHGGGGGGGFGGGGGGGGGGGEGGGDLFNLIFWLLFTHPHLGVPFLAIAISFIIIATKRGTFVYQSGVIQRGSEALQSQERDTMIAALKQADPAFEEYAFTQRVNMAFRKIQEAWSIQKLEVVRAFISDGVHERFNLQFDEQRTLGYRNQLDNVRVDEVSIAQIDSDHFFDQIAVRIAASADDYNVSLADGRRLETNSRGEFVEVWSFLRRRGARTTVGKPGLIEGNCPNCGAAIEMNQNANCQFCKALLRSGEYDWVLAEITQEIEWQPERRSDIPGVDPLIARDASFNLQDLEDRASVMFWRRCASDRTGNIAPLKKIAAPQFCEKYDQRLHEKSPQERTYIGECAVGSVDTLGLILDQDLDRAFVEVRWSGTHFAANGGKPKRTGEPTLARTAFVMARKAGSKTEISQTISSAHCPNCGAPDTGGTSNACQFCGTVLNDGAHGWVLWDIITPGAAFGLLRNDQQPHETRDGDFSIPPSTAGLLSWMVLMCASDGQVDPKEMEMLTRVAAKRNLSPQRLQDMISAATRKELEAPQPANADEARNWLTAMATAALADGQLTRDEYGMLQTMAQRVGLGDYDVRMMVKKLRVDLYNASRNALRAQRGGTDISTTNS